MPDLMDAWAARRWLGGWAEIDAALADLHERCRPGPLHRLAVQANRPDLLAPPAPVVLFDLWTDAQRIGTYGLESRGVRLAAPGSSGPLERGDALLVHASWPVELRTAVHFRWGRDGVSVRMDASSEPWSIRAGAHARGEHTTLQPGVSVFLGCRGSMELCRGDTVAARVSIRPHPGLPEVASVCAPPEPPLELADRRVLVRVILEVAASTHPVGDALSSLLARHEEPNGAALAARLGPQPVEVLGRWLADERNDALRLALADGLAGTGDPATLRARLPKALRCWIPRLRRARPQRALRLVAGEPWSACLDD